MLVLNLILQHGSGYHGCRYSRYRLDNVNLTYPNEQRFYVSKRAEHFFFDRVPSLAVRVPPSMRKVMGSNPSPVTTSSIFRWHRPSALNWESTKNGRYWDRIPAPDDNDPRMAVERQKGHLESPRRTTSPLGNKEGKGRHSIHLQMLADQLEKNLDNSVPRWCLLYRRRMDL